MLHVATRLAPSPIAGIGLFAAEPLTKGQVIWTFKAGFDLMFEVGMAEALLSGPALAQFQKYTYLCRETGLFILCSDDARFMNHSTTPNVDDLSYRSAGMYGSVAARDIAAGEELLSDYRAIDALYPGYEATLRG